MVLFSYFPFYCILCFSTKWRWTDLEYSSQIHKHNENPNPFVKSELDVQCISFVHRSKVAVPEKCSIQTKVNCDPEGM